MMQIEPILNAIPPDLHEEFELLAELLPEGSPLPYVKAKLLVLSWTRLGHDALDWSGAKLVIKIDPGPYESEDLKYGSPPNETVDRSVDLWAPFSSEQWRVFGQDVSLFDLAVHLKVKMGTWGTTPVARRRHVTKDRLDGLGLGCQIHPADSTATLYLCGGERSLWQIIEKDLADQVR